MEIKRQSVRLYLQPASGDVMLAASHSTVHRGNTCDPLSNWAKQNLVQHDCHTLHNGDVKKMIEWKIFCSVSQMETRWLEIHLKTREGEVMGVMGQEEEGWGDGSDGTRGGVRWWEWWGVEGWGDGSDGVRCWEWWDKRRKGEVMGVMGQEEGWGDGMRRVRWWGDRRKGEEIGWEEEGWWGEVMGVMGQEEEGWGRRWWGWGRVRRGGVRKVEVMGVMGQEEGWGDDGGVGGDKRRGETMGVRRGEIVGVRTPPLGTQPSFSPPPGSRTPARRADTSPDPSRMLPANTWTSPGTAELPSRAEEPGHGAWRPGRTVKPAGSTHRQARAGELSPGLARPPAGVKLLAFSKLAPLTSCPGDRVNKWRLRTFDRPLRGGHLVGLFRRHPPSRWAAGCSLCSGRNLRDSSLAS